MLTVLAISMLTLRFNIPSVRSITATQVSVVPSEVSLMVESSTTICLFALCTLLIFSVISIYDCLLTCEPPLTHIQEQISYLSAPKIGYHGEPKNG